VNRRANFAPDFIVDAVGDIFAAHVFAAQLVLGLRGAEKIGRQFQTAHVVKNMFLAFEPLPLMDVAHPQPP